jgi:hypothetical protein
MPNQMSRETKDYVEATLHGWSIGSLLFRSDKKS